VLLQPAGERMCAKIADFGSASELAYANTFSSLSGGEGTEGGSEGGGEDMGEEVGGGGHSMAGSPYWMAPEHIKGTAYGRKADIWSYGGVLLEMLTGRPPWYNASVASSAGGFAIFQLLYMIAEASGPPPMPPSEAMPAGLEMLLLACFERDVAKRPDSSELLQRLGDV